MRRISEETGSLVSKVILLLIVVGILSVYISYWCWKAINASAADAIVNSVLTEAELEKNRLSAESNSDETEENAIKNSYKSESKGYIFMIKEGSTAALVKVETGKKAITPAVCTALKKKFKETQWRDVFSKVVVIDRMGDEKTDVLIYNCPKESMPALRFYVKFAESEEVELEPQEEETPTPEVKMPPLPAPLTPTASPISTPTTTRRVAPSSNVTRTNCPSGSSRSGSGDTTNVSGCRCNSSTPVWSGSRCISRCPGNKILVPDSGRCVCPTNTVIKLGSSDLCVECNENTDCASDKKCVGNKCVGESEEYDDCRWGICQTCDGKTRENIAETEGCEVAGLPGLCNGNGTCYPVKGRRCSSIKGCPSGFFCNFGGTYNSTRKQKGKFGQTPNVCQVVAPQEFTYNKVTYYYNSQKDLKAWCRAANNKPNCLWGYLAKSGAESWCASLGKRLLTRSEMAAVWSELKKELPQTYTGYSYWVQEGAWIEDRYGRLGFGKGHPDGYGGRGGVVCR